MYEILSAHYLVAGCRAYGLFLLGEKVADPVVVVEAAPAAMALRRCRFQAAPVRASATSCERTRA